jgi:hypothetical protein
VLKLLLEVVDRRPGLRPAAVRPRVDVVEGVPGRAGISSPMKKPIVSVA